MDNEGRIALVVDDSKVARTILGRILTSVGLSVIEAEDGVKAIELARAMKPHIIFMDIEMPVMDGIKATQHLLGDPETSDIPVIVISIRKEKEIRLGMIRSGARDYIVKPLQKNRVLDIVERYLGAEAAFADQRGAFSLPLNTSIMAKEAKCLFHNDATIFQTFSLKAKTQVVEYNIFDIPVYRKALPDAEQCDFYLYEVRICPDCYFASSSDYHFVDIHNPSSERLSVTGRLKKGIQSSLGEREAIIKRHHGSIFTSNRTPRDAVIAFELAISSARAIYAADPVKYSLFLCRAANYALKAAVLSEKTDAPQNAGEFKKEALATLERAFFEIDMGINLFRTIYQIIALSLDGKDTAKAKQYFAKFQDLHAKASGKFSEKERIFFERYFDRSKKLITKALYSVQGTTS